MPLEVPQDRDGSFIPRLVLKASAVSAAGRHDHFAVCGGMTLRDIQFHLASTIGTEVSHETVSKIVDEISEEVLACRNTGLEPLYPVIYRS